MEAELISSVVNSRPISHADDIERYWNQFDLLTIADNNRHFMIGFACSDKMVERVQRLRYNVFNVEMGHHTEDSTEQLDKDKYDAQMCHIILIAKSNQQVVGTYRVQTFAMAQKHHGFYSASEFDLSDLYNIQDQLLECGRACVAKEFRQTNSIHALLSGIRAFAILKQKHWVFGCCSISTQDTELAWNVYAFLEKNGYLHPDIRVSATPDYRCPAAQKPLEDLTIKSIPKLFRAYLRLGNKVISEPCLDKIFGTIDFLTMIDANQAKLSSLVVPNEKS